jgi:multiple sugar transport system permease protein
MKKTLVFSALCLLSLLVWIPLIMLVSGSLTGAGEISKNLSPVLAGETGFASWPLMPRYPTLRGYIELLLDAPEFFVMFWNSCALVFPVVAGQIIVGAPAAWALTRPRFRQRKILRLIYIALMLLPFQVTMVSNYLVLDGLKLLDSRWAVILPGIFSPFPVFIMMRFFSAVPEALLEAAALDGAGPVRRFLYVGLPLGVPGILSASVLGFLEYWSLIEQPLTFFKNRHIWPLSLYLPVISTDRAGVSLAASILMLLPALLVFLFGQHSLEQGIQASGLKE